MSRPPVPPEADIRWLPNPNKPSGWRYGELKRIDPDGTRVIYDSKHGYCRYLHKSVPVAVKKLTTKGTIKWEKP